MKNEISIDFVIEHDLKDYKKSNATNGYNLNCPLCGGKKKFHVDIYRNLARCAKCGNGIDSIKGFNPITLHAKLTGLSTKDAYKDLCKIWQGLPSKTKVIYKQKKPQKPSTEIMPSNLRDSFYRTMLKNLFLKKEHLSNLLKRGLDKKTIIKTGYKSIFIGNTKKFTDSIIEELPNDTKKYLKEEFAQNKKRYSVPGFYNLFTKKQNFVNCSPGFLIPVKNALGEIEGFQIRHDNENENRYTWLSSSYVDGGVETKIRNIHHVGFDEYYKTFGKEPRIVYLTEGPLKGNIASYFTKRPFIAIPGLSNVSQLKEECEYLRRMDCESIYLCIDMDYRNKKEVAQATKKIISIIKQTGLEVYMGSWSAKYKGIDDFLLARHKKETSEKVNFEKV